jgi:subtilisin-like proprotein convertase family protein
MVTLVNNGGADATNARGTLSTTTPGVTIVSPSFSLYPAIAAAGGTGANNTPFALSLAPSLPCGAVVMLRLSVTFAGVGTSPTVLDFSQQTGTPATTAVPLSFTGPPTAIPDGIEAGVNVPLAVSGLGSVSKVELRFDGSACSTATGATTVGLDHSWVGDLVVTLTSPAGTTVKLMDRPGGAGNSGNNLCGTVLSDGAPSSIQTIAISQAPYTGSFKPASPLAAFRGESANGTWVLNASDLVPTDTGSVRAFTLLVTGFACGP